MNTYCVEPPGAGRLPKKDRKKPKEPINRNKRKAAKIYKAENQKYFDIFGQHDIPKSVLDEHREYINWHRDDDKPSLYILTQRSNEEMLCDVMRCVKLLQLLPMSFRGNKEMMREVITRHGWIALQFASIEIRSDKEFILLAVIKNEDTIRLVPLYLRDKNIVFAAAIKNAYLLKYAPGTLRDKEFIKDLISCNIRVFDHPFNIFKDEKEVLLHALRCGVLIYHIPKKFTDDDDVAYAAAYAAGTLSLFSARIRNNKQIVLEAVRKYGCAYIHASKELKDDYDVMLVAFANSGIYLKFKKRNCFVPSIFLYDTVKIDSRPFIMYICDLFYARQSILTISRVPANDTNLNLINGHGPYYAKIFKRRIASYLGVQDIYGWHIDSHLNQYGWHIDSDANPEYIDYWRLFDIAFKAIFGPN
jgi:hypothetical protein